MIAPTKVLMIPMIAMAILTVSQHISAQYRDSLGTPWNNPISATMSTMIWAKINEITMYGAANRRGGGRGSSRANTTARSKPEVVPAYRLYPPVRFKPTGTRLTLQKLADDLGGNAAEKAEMKRVLTGIMDKYDAAAAAKGYPNDLALAFVSYIGLSSHVYNQRTGELLLPFEQNIGLRDVLAEEAVNRGSFAHLNDRQKQEMYEYLVMTAGLTYHFYKVARKKNNTEELKICNALAERNLKNVGIVP